ncbi:MAG: hypothetical protein PVI01_15400 [Gemmatimonadales bacterium]
MARRRRKPVGIGERCGAVIHPWGTCANRGVVEEKGKKWCRIHAPSIEARRREERRRKWEEEFAAKQRARERKDRIFYAEQELLRAVMETEPRHLGSKVRRLRQEVLDARSG